MPMTVIVHESTLLAKLGRETALTLPSERLTVRELIRAYVYQHLTEQHARRRLAELERTGLPVETVPPPAEAFEPTPFEPTPTERLLNGPLRRPAPGDWQTEAERVVRQFERGQILLVVDERQVDEIDADLDLRPDAQVTFLRLVPLAGG